MPMFASLTLNDGATIPVAHTFDPLTLIGNEAKFVDRSGGITVGYPILSVQSWQPSKTSRLQKTRFKVVLPIMEVVNASTYNGITPAPTKAYDMTAEIVVFSPERSTLQNRKDIRAYALNLLSSALAAAMIEAQETVY